MVVITVKGRGDGLYEVTVRQASSTTEHRVTVRESTLERIGRGASAEDLVGASFHFLLEREPKESILREFDLTTISRYFPEYEDEVRAYLEPR